MPLRITYHRPQDLVADWDAQFTEGGLLVRVEPPTGLDRGAQVELEIVTPDGLYAVTANVIQLLPGAGVAVGFDAGSLPELLAAVEDARSAPKLEGAAPEHAWVAPGRPVAAGPSASSAERAAASDNAFERVRRASVAAKREFALHGSKQERTAVLRDPNKTLHPLVLRNPGLTLDEVASFAGMTGVAVELLAGIAQRPEWGRRPEVAAALVRNPRTPIPLAVRLLEYVRTSELRHIAKGTHVRTPIATAARKRLLR